MQIVFRVDASNWIGTGHVVRCLAFANALRDQGAECRFVHRLHRGHMAEAIRSQGFVVHELPVPEADSLLPTDIDYAHWLGVSPEQDACETAEAVGGSAVQWLIVDHYALDSGWGRSMRACVERIAVIDDLCNRTLESDLLLDQTHRRSKEDYRSLVPPHCKTIVGAWNALLRRDFASARQKALLGRDENSKKGIVRVLICMGGNDQEDAAVALQGVERSGLFVDVDVMIGGQAPNLDSLRRKVFDSPRVRLHIDTQEVPDLMARADLAIGAGGTTSWERCCMGLPALAIRAAENQRFILESLAAEGAVVAMGGLTTGLEEHIAESLNTLNDDPSRLYAMSVAARRICDGKGAQRLADLLLAEKA